MINSLDVFYSLQKFNFYFFIFMTNNFMTKFFMTTNFMTIHYMTINSLTNNLLMIINFMSFFYVKLFCVTKDDMDDKKSREHKGNNTFPSQILI